MRFLPKHPGARIIEFDLTPMVDCVFLLNIFFMTTTQFARMTKADIALPEQRGQEERAVARPHALVINVTARGEIIVDERPVSRDAALRMVAIDLKGVGGDGALLDLTIRADKDAPASAVNELAEGLIALGVRGWRLATEAPTNRGRPGA